MVRFPAGAAGGSFDVHHAAEKRCRRGLAGHRRPDEFAGIKRAGEVIPLAGPNQPLLSEGENLAAERESNRGTLGIPPRHRGNAQVECVVAFGPKNERHLGPVGTPFAGVLQLELKGQRRVRLPGSPEAEAFDKPRTIRGRGGRRIEIKIVLPVFEAQPFDDFDSSPAVVKGDGGRRERWARRRGGKNR